MNPQKSPSTICAGCQRPLPAATVYFCRTCWPLVPAPDRIDLYQMHARKQDTTTKVAACVRKLLKKKSAQEWAAPRPGPAEPPPSPAAP